MGEHAVVKGISRQISGRRIVHRHAVYLHAIHDNIFAAIIGVRLFECRNRTAADGFQYLTSQPVCRLHILLVQFLSVRRAHADAGSVINRCAIAAQTKRMFA